MNEESGAVRCEMRAKERASEKERKVSEAAFFIASKNRTAMARTTAHRQAGGQAGGHTYPHTSHSIDRAPNWLPG